MDEKIIKFTAQENQFGIEFDIRILKVNIYWVSTFNLRFTYFICDLRQKNLENLLVIFMFKRKI